MSERGNKLYDSLGETWKKVKERRIEKAGATKAKQTAVRHLDEKNALNAEARDVKARYRHECAVEEGRYADRAVAPGGMAERHRQGLEAIVTKYAKKREEQEARHTKELAEARKADSRALGV